VLVKSPNSVVEGCQFSYSSAVATENRCQKQSLHSITGANELSSGSVALGTIYVGMWAPEGAKGLPESKRDD
jgi:hypothetical protein